MHTYIQGDVGPSGGIQRLHVASIRTTKYYIPDRVVRYIEGDSNPMDPWPNDSDGDTISSSSSLHAEEEFDKNEI